MLSPRCQRNLKACHYKSEMTFVEIHEVHRGNKWMGSLTLMI